MSQLSKSKLFSSVRDRASVSDELQQLVARELAKIPSCDVSPTLDMPRFRDELQCFDFTESKSLMRVTQWVVERLSGGAVQMTHPRYFGLYNPAPTLPSEFADAIASAFNPQVCVHSHAPVAVEIERHVIDQVNRRLGYPDRSGGHFTSGGSEANRTAVVCALTRNNKAFPGSGARSFDGQPRLYVSRESHLAWYKIAHECGIGRDAVVLVATDGKGRMDGDRLEQAIVDDLQVGQVPIMIAATAGTTNAGVVDPLARCRDLADQHQLWLHTDAAWGGALIASDTLRNEIAGAESSDSITIDAHKWFATTMGTGMFLTREPEVLQAAFTVSTDYMPSNDRSVDLYVTSSQWSRRFLGLRLFMSLAVAGWTGYAEHVERSVALIDRLNDRMQRARWRVANDSRMAVTCLVPPEGERDVEAIVAEIVSSGEHWVSMTRFEHQPVVRACLTNGRTGAEDIDALAEALCRVSRASVG